MSTLKVSGKIIKISERQNFDSGAQKLSFRIDTLESFNNIVEFDLFKGAEYISLLDNFENFNKIGDFVDVEFKLNTNHWTKEGNDKVFTSLSAWRIDKVKEVGDISTGPVKIAEPDDLGDLPF